MGAVPATQCPDVGRLERPQPWPQRARRDGAPAVMLLLALAAEGQLRQRHLHHGEYETFTVRDILKYQKTPEFHEILEISYVKRSIFAYDA